MSIERAPSSSTIDAALRKLGDALNLFERARGQWEKLRQNPHVEPTITAVEKKVAEVRAHPTVATAERRWDLLSQDPHVREAAVATRRTIVNSAILTCEFIPLVGDAPSWIADLAKFTVRTDRKVRVFIESVRAKWQKREPRHIPPSGLDTTPDVSSWIALGSETVTMLRAMTGFTVPMPTHWIEGGLQLKADLPKLRDGLARAREIIEQDRRDREELAHAVEVFDSVAAEPQ